MPVVLLQFVKFYLNRNEVIVTEHVPERITDIRAVIQDIDDNLGAALGV
jgi:hypothetical protein